MFGLSSNYVDSEQNKRGDSIVIQLLKGGIVVTDQYGSKYYIDFDRWLKKSEWGSE